MKDAELGVVSFLLRRLLAARFKCGNAAVDAAHPSCQNTKVALGNGLVGFVLHITLTTSLC